MSVEGGGEITQNYTLLSATATTQECPYRSVRQLVHLCLPSILPRKKYDWNHKPSHLLKDSLHFIIPHYDMTEKNIFLMQILSS